MYVPMADGQDAGVINGINPSLRLRAHCSLELFLVSGACTYNPSHALPPLQE